MREIEEDKLRQKEKICKSVAQYLDITESVSNEILKEMENKGILRIESYLVSDMPVEFATIKMQSTGRSKGTSYKIRNVTVDLKSAFWKFVTIGGSIGALAQDFKNNPSIITIFSALAVIGSVKDICKQELDSDMAFLLAALWKNRARYVQPLEIEKGYEIVNKELEKYNREPLSKTKYHDMLDALETIKCIELIKNRIHLKEKVYIKY